jgi:hypothetical protein
MRSDRRIRPTAERLPLRSILLVGTALTSVAVASIFERSRPAFADDGTACGNPGGPNCQIGLISPAAGHGQTGATPSPDPITHDFTDSRSWTATGSAGAIDFSTRAGNGGDANQHGQNGGQGGAGGAIGPVTVGAGVTAQGVNSNGILDFLSQGGNGGGGDGAASVGGTIEVAGKSLQLQALGGIGPNDNGGANTTFGRPSSLPSISGWSARGRP